MFKPAESETTGLWPVFHERGYLILRGILEPEVIDDARAALAELVDRLAQERVAVGRSADGCPHEPFETRLWRLFEDDIDAAPLSFRQCLHLPGLFGLLFHPELLDLVEEFLGPEIRLYPNYTARPKLPAWDGTLVLWHQDGGYTRPAAGDGVESLRMVNVWAPLVPADERNGCLEVIPGTHRLGVVPHVTRRHYLEIDEAYLEPHRRDAVALPANPGDVILFHNLLFHRGLPNNSNHIRWTCDWRYQDARQPTLRPEEGHLARSRSHPERAVRTPEQWASLTWR
jgi:phytanoyl-CoA hydroxylase